MRRLASGKAGVENRLHHDGKGLRLGGSEDPPLPRRWGGCIEAGLQTRLRRTHAGLVPRAAAKNAH
jgi:hypothetical protein